MFKRFLLAALLVPVLALLPGVAPAADDEPEYGVPVVAVNWTSLHRTGAAADVWVTKSFAEPITLGHDLYPHQSQKLQYAIDCADRTYALEQWVLTDGPDGQGNTVWADRAERLDFMQPVKGTVEAGVVHAACEVNPKSTVAGTPSRSAPLE